VNTALVEHFIPVAARRVLDVGCGTGANLLAWKMHRSATRPDLPDPVLHGVEGDGLAAWVAGNRLDHAWKGNVEDNLQRIPDNS